MCVELTVNTCVNTRYQIISLSIHPLLNFHLSNPRYFFHMFQIPPATLQRIPVLFSIDSSKLQQLQLPNNPPGFEQSHKDLPVKEATYFATGQQLAIYIDIYNLHEKIKSAFKKFCFCFLALLKKIMPFCTLSTCS